MDQTEKKSAKTQEMTRTIIINDYHDKTEVHNCLCLFISDTSNLINVVQIIMHFQIACNSSSEHSEVEDDYKIDKLFYRISYVCFD